VAKLSLSLLGPFQATLDGAPIGSFKTDKVRALLAYLAVEADRPHRRETLCGLLWPESTDDSARASLRNALSLLRRAIRDRDASPPHLLVERETIQFNAESAYWLDVQAFGDAMTASKAHAHDELARCPECMTRLGEAVGLYQDEFLSGFSVDSAPLEEWLVVQREALHLQVLEALDHLALYHEAVGAYGRMLEDARRQVRLEPWRERAHRQWMRALALSGHRGAALAQYEACRQVLDEELGIEPEVETEALYQRIREGALQPPVEEVVPPPRTPSSVTPIPLPPAAEAEPAALSAASSLPGSVLGQVEGERRYVTALFCMVACLAPEEGALDIEARAEAVSGALWLVESEVARLGGEVSQRREGGLVATFGATTAHEDDPERAVLAALAIEEAMGHYAADLARREGIELQVRMGISSGEAIVTRVGEGASQRAETLLSEGASLGDRLLEMAGAEGVLVAAQTHRLVAPLFEWQVLGERALGGVQAPVTVYRPLVRRPEVGKGRGIEGLVSPLVGRERELSALQGAVARVRAGSGGIVTVVGEAGLGKSRLLAEIRKHNLAKVRKPLQGWDVSWVEGRCLSYGGAVAYLPWLDMLRGLVGAATDAAPVAARDALRERVRALCGDRAEEVYPYLGRMLSLPLEEDAEARLRGLDAEGLRVLTFRAAEMLIEHVARQRPLVVVCEDLHWADPTSLALLEQVFALTDRVPVLFVCVLRPETEHGCWRVREAAARDYRHRHVDLWLEPLSGEESERLVRSLLEIEELPQALHERIARYTEGNPLYLEEVLRSLIAEGAIAYDRETGRWQVTCDVAALSIPDTLHGVLMARIDRLPRGSRQVLQLAAVIGHVFARRVLAAVVGEREGLDEHLVLLQRAQMIREQARLPELEYAFHHQLTMEAAYASLLRRKQRALHRRVAEALERLYGDRIEERLGLLAHHWERAGEATQAVYYLRRAGEQAVANYANEEAIEYLSRALDLTPTTALGERYELVLSRERVYDLCAMREAQSEDLRTLEELAEALDDDRRRAEVALRRARYDNRTGAYGQAIAAARHVIHLGRAAQIVAAEAAGYREWARALFYQYRYEETCSRADRALDLARQAGLQQIEIDSLHTLGVCHLWLDQYDEAEACFAQELRLCRLVGSRWSEGEALRDVGYLALLRGDVAGSRTYFQRSLHVCHETGNRRDEGWAQLGLGQCCMGCGDLAQAEAHFLQALRINRETKDVNGEWYSAGGLGNLYLFFWGDDARARPYYERLRDSPPPVESGYMAAAWPLLSLGQTSFQRGEYDRAVAAYERALYLSRDLGDVPIESLVLLHLGKVADRVRGNRELARRRVGEALPLFRAAGWRYPEGLALAYLAVLSHWPGEDEVADTHARQALHVIDGPLDPAVWDYPVLRLFMDAALVGVGLFRAELGQFAQAAGLYHRALRGMRVWQPHVAPEPLAGLARIAMAQGDTVGAMSYVEESLPYLQSCPTPLCTFDAFGVHLTCCRVLAAAGDPRAEEVLGRAYHLLQERALKIADPDLRRSFVENVPSHHELIAAYEQR
jgi:predicted ATPase/DNA-binding SARP family transcriptional activator/class 3 adenylate cyclase